MDSIIEFAINIINNIGFFPLFLIGLLVSLFLFWSESHTHKDRNSLFDMWIITIIFAMFWGRLSFIIVNWEIFSELPWSLAPYERYGDVIYFFRLLPWRFFDLSDGGFLFTSVFTGYLIFAFLYNIFIKKWKWREMFFPVIISAEAFLCITLIVYGALTGFADIVYGGLIIALIIAIFMLIIAILRLVFRQKYSYNVELLNGVIHFLVIVFVIVSFGIITRLFFSYDISLIDQINVVLMNIMGIVATLYFVFFEKKPTDKSESVIIGRGKSFTININKPFKVNNDKD
jgi:hypothetical protein